MNCYNHQDVTAVAMCRACSKGLCPNCSKEIAGGISCHNETCIEFVKNTADCMDYSFQAMRKRTSWTSSGLIVFPILALGIIGFAIPQFYAGDYISGTIFTVLGLGMVAMGRTLKVKSTKTD